MLYGFVNGENWYFENELVENFTNVYDEKNMMGLFLCLFKCRHFKCWFYGEKLRDWSV